MLTLDILNQREAEIRQALAGTLTRAEQMRGALECLAILKKDCADAEAQRRAAEEAALSEAPAAESVEVPAEAEAEAAVAESFDVVRREDDVPIGA